MPSAEELTLRVGTDADLPAVLDLMRVSLGEGKIPRTREFFTWKHRENPFGCSPMWVALAGPRLVGLRIFMRWSWQWGPERVTTAVRAVDTATHPDFQGQGIFKRLTLALVEEVSRTGVQLIFNTPNEKSRPGYLKMGWRNAGKAGLWLRPELGTRALRHVLNRRSSRSTADTHQHTGPSRELVAALQEAEESRLLERVAQTSPARYRTPKDGAYLSWRYPACPAARYEVASSDPRHALVVYRVRERHGLRELSISELLFERSRRGSWAAINALKTARERERPDYTLVAFERDPLHAAVLSAGGFLPVPRVGPTVTTRALHLTDAAPDPHDVRSFRASIGDLELF